MQIDLFGHTELPPASHRNDPDTSREAEAKIASHRVSMVARLADIVAKNPGMTRTGIAAISGFDNYQVNKRLADAERLGYVRKGAPQLVNGYRQSTWFPK